MLLLLGLRERAVDDELARVAQTLNLDGARPRDVMLIQLRLAAAAQRSRNCANTWLERAAFCRAFGDAVGVPQLTEKSLLAWLPDLPLAIMLDPLIGLLNRSVLWDEPHRHCLRYGRVFATKSPVAN